MNARKSATGLSRLEKLPFLAQGVLIQVVIAALVWTGVLAVFPHNHPLRAVTGAPAVAAQETSSPVRLAGEPAPGAGRRCLACALTHVSSKAALPQVRTDIRMGTLLFIPPDTGSCHPVVRAFHPPSRGPPART
ncbi:MAG: hypothetical protein ACE5ID_05300 [Acidobacteriota bacterium]